MFPELNSGWYKECRRHQEFTLWCCIVFIVSEIVITDILYSRRQTITQILRTQCIMHFVKCCQLAICTPRRKIVPPCFKGKRTSTCKLFLTNTSQACSNFVLMKARHIFDRVCLQIVHFSFLRTLTCLKVQLLYIMVKSQTQVQRGYLLYMCT